MAEEAGHRAEPLLAEVLERGHDPRTGLERSQNRRPRLPGPDASQIWTEASVAALPNLVASQAPRLRTTRFPASSPGGTFTWRTAGGPPLTTVSGRLAVAVPV